MFHWSNILELIHGDLCGPITLPTSAENRYFLLLVDDYNHVMWVYMLKIKYEALNTFKKFRVLVENGSKRRIQVLRINKGVGVLLSKIHDVL